MHRKNRSRQCGDVPFEILNFIFKLGFAGKPGAELGNGTLAPGSGILGFELPSAEPADAADAGRGISDGCGAGEGEGPVSDGDAEGRATVDGLEAGKRDNRWPARSLMIFEGRSVLMLGRLSGGKGRLSGLAKLAAANFCGLKTEGAGAAFGSAFTSLGARLVLTLSVLVKCTPVFR